MERRGKIAAIIVAAGKGTRAGGEVPKQWRMLGARRVLEHAIAAFKTGRHCDTVVVVVPDSGPPSDIDLRDVSVVAGGTTRQQSVRNALEFLQDVAPDKVLIHDAARPLVPHAVIDGVIEALDHSLAAAPGLAVSDTLWRRDEASIGEVLDRSHLFRAQTPQGFHYDTILAAHRNASDGMTDDASVARAAGIPVMITRGDEANFKLTYEADFERAERMLRGSMDIRVGNGFDVHRFGEGDHVVLCGVRVPHERGLQGHSDADVAMHAVTDAIYGALAEGDIGRHFPPSEAQWKGADSAIFLEHAVKLAADKCFKISNIDVTIICERPKIGPHSDAMRTQMAAIMGLEAERISVKATTSERLGFTGREEGIAAQATAVLTT